MGTGSIIWLAAGLAVAAAAWFIPLAADGVFRRLKSQARILCLAAPLLILLIRAALLPFWPIPKPYIYDEFGYLLQADTFSLGRLTNPAHPMAPFFESIYILQNPSYTAKFPPGQGLFMAFGKTAFGDAWFGVWLSCGLLMGSLIWCLLGWVPTGWALFGALLATPVCLFSYWMNSHWGGAVTAIGGALVTGALGRLLHNQKPYNAWPLGVGCVVLMCTRPFEGLLLIVPAFAILLAQRLPWMVWARVVLIGVLGAGWLGFYNYKVTGNPLLLPYVLYDRQHPSTTHFAFLPTPTAKPFPHQNFAWIDQWEREASDRTRTLQFPMKRLTDLYEVLTILLGTLAMAMPLVLFGSEVLRNRRNRVLAVLVGVALVGSFLETVYYPHYFAPALAALLVLLVQSYRHLRIWRWDGKPVGQFLARFAPLTVLLLLGGKEAVVMLRHQPIEETIPVNGRRDKLAGLLEERDPLADHLIVVQYTTPKIPHEEWVYNLAEIDKAHVVWAQDMGKVANRKLLRYYAGRKVWLLQPDINPDQLNSYVE